MAEEPLLSVEEVATRLKINPTTVYRLVRRGQIPGFKVGDQWRFSQEMLDSWMKDQTTLHMLEVEDQHEDSGSDGASDGQSEIS